MSALGSAHERGEVFMWAGQTPGNDRVSDLVAQAQAERIVLQQSTPLAESLEWDLGQRYLRQRGSRAFLSDPVPVPFAVNNTGSPSERVAQLLFNNLAAGEAKGDLNGDLIVLEIGMGLGLFARYFLDIFRDLCARHDKDYYDRLTYVAADRSEGMLLDAARHGVFANHPGRY